MNNVDPKKAENWHSHVAGMKNIELPDQNAHVAYTNVRLSGVIISYSGITYMLHGTPSYKSILPNTKVNFHLTF